MPKINAFATLLFVSLLSGATPAAFAPLYETAPSFCDAYATKAVSQNQTAQAAKCEFSGARWNDDLEGQQKWCSSVREEVAQAETLARTKDLLVCFGTDVGVKDSDLSLIPDDLGGEMIAAVQKGKLSRTQQLLAAGASLDYEGMQGNDGKMLFVAMSNGHEDLIKFFIGLGQDPNSTFNGGWSPIAMFVGKPEMLEYLLEHGGDANSTGELYEFNQLPILSAINSNDLESLNILIKYGARVQVDEMMDECMGPTLLDYAIKKAKPAIVAALRKAGAKTYAECSQQQ